VSLIIVVLHESARAPPPAGGPTDVHFDFKGTLGSVFLVRVLGLGIGF